MPSDLPDLEEYHIPSVEELEGVREAYGIPRAEFSRRAGFKSDVWDKYLDGRPPRVDRLRAFLAVLREADPEADHETRGRPARCPTSDHQDPQAPADGPGGER